MGIELPRHKVDLPMAEERRETKITKTLRWFGIDRKKICINRKDLKILTETIKARGAKSRLWE
jgi:hypothetical protein